MGWVRIDDNAPHHRKLLEAGPAACWLWVCGLGYGGRLNTDCIPYEAVAHLGVRSHKRLSASLVAAGLWHRTEDGYRIHDFHDFHATPAERQEQEEKRKNRNMRYYRRLKTQEDIKTRLKTVTQDVIKTRLKTATQDGDPDPDPDPDPDQPPYPLRGLRARFDRFWLSYPRKTGKGAAWAWWKRHKPSEELTVLMIASVGDQSRSDQWQRDGGQYIPHPRTWLSQERWTDEAPRDLVSDELEKFRPTGA